MTTVATLLAASVGRSAAGLVAIAAAVLTGQLSVGWSNDAHDAGDDLRAARADKPVVAGEVTASTLWVGAFAAAMSTTVLSLVAVGQVPGALHLLAVAFAWIYNLGVARTSWSFLPYVGAFALLPTVVATAGVPPRSPAPWAVVGFSAMGLGAHLVNGIRDLEVDRRVGLDGAALRLGPRAGRVLAAAAFVVAGGAVGMGLRDARPLLALAVPAGTVAALVPVVWLAPPRVAFRAVLMVAVGLVTVMVLAAFAGEVTITN